MDKKDEFELDFDFEKEYGFSPEDIMSPEYDSDDEDFDIDLDDLEILTPKKEERSAAPAEFTDEDFGSPEDYKLLEDYDTAAPMEQQNDYEQPAQVLPDDRMMDYDQSTQAMSEEQNALAEEALTYDEFDDVEDKGPAAMQQEPQEVPPVQPRRRERHGSQRRQNPLRAQNQLEPQPQQGVPYEAPANPRRRKRSQMRIIKEDYLPVGIAGLALLLCLIFIVGGVVRTIKNRNDRNANELAASEQAASEAARLQAEAANIREAAATMAAGYDFEAAISLIDSFSGNFGDFPELLADRNQYAQTLQQMVEISDFTNIPNLSFHVLIADSATAFNSEPYGPKYLQNFVTIDEFSRILQQLYDNGYVLVNFDDFIEEIPDASGDVTFQTKSIKLPSGKKPIMITETLVNYFPYMVDGDDDGQPDADGDGFACKLVVKDGKITSMRVNAAGETIYGAYDMVPILEEFIEEHPDFSYRGARATLAVTGSDGIFGYRLKNAGEDEINACKTLVQALRDQGYLLACNSYQNISYATINATDIQADLEKWNNDIVPVIGDVDILVYALGSDITDYNGSKYNVMANAGFKYFVSNATNGIPTTEVNVDFVRQYRIMVTGSLMVNSPDSLEQYFTVSHVLSNDR